MGTLLVGKWLTESVVPATYDIYLIQVDKWSNKSHPKKRFPTPNAGLVPSTISTLGNNAL